ncbi:coil containing protein [Vibrio phage 1.081.O._10N.286.52.C2]|nr:coil containing protein [Vibrio phage 1.081.O._10N.286.52.C2]
MSADNTKKINEIIGRLDMMILQQEDRPEVYTMQRIARNIGNIDITTATLLDTFNAVFKVNTEAVEKQKTLFQRVMGNFESSSNKIRAAIVSLADIMRTSLDFKGHLARIQNGVEGMHLTAKMQFARAQEGFTRWAERLIFRVNDLKRTIGLQANASDDLNDFLKNGAGQNSPLTVGYISNLYKKIFAYQLLTENRNRKTLQKYNKENMKVQRNIASDIKRVADHLAGKQLGWIAKLFQYLGVGIAFAGGKLATFATTMMSATAAGGKFGKLGKVVSNILLGFGKFGQTGGGVIQKLAQDLGGTVKGWMLFVVKRLFLGLGRMVTLMMSPVGLAAMIAGYGIYKLFEEELDRIWASLTSIFSDPEKRALLMDKIGAAFTGMIDTIGSWFGMVGDDIKDSMPVGLFDGLMSRFNTMKRMITTAFNMYVNAVNNVIAGFASIPDAFELLMIAIDEMMLGIKEFAVNTLKMLPDWARSDGMNKFIDNSNIDDERATLDARKASTQGRIDERFDTNYVKNAGDAVTDGIVKGAKAYVGAYVAMGNGLKDAVGSLATGLEDLDKELINGVAEKKEMNAIALQAAKEKARAEQLEALKAKGQAAIITAEAKANDLLEASKRGVTQAQTAIQNSVSSVQNHTSFNTPVTVNSDAKNTGFRRNYN